ncbi:MAG: hypothetical protein H0X01_11020, partial [Nitrospira sp.]|nr:hypothetical protein [Nitrospira sp.]
MHAYLLLVLAMIFSACVPPEVAELDDKIGTEDPVTAPTASLEGEWFVNFDEGGTARVTLEGDESLIGILVIDKFVFHSVYGTATTDT